MNKIKHFIQQSWLLIVAAFVFGLLLALTNAALAPIIEQNEIDKLNNLMNALIIEADTFETVLEGGKIAGAKTNIYKALNANRESAGFAFVAVGTGFADKIKLVIAVDDKCERFLGFKVLKSLETPGFGSKISEEFFGNQFIDAPAGKLNILKTGDNLKIDDEIIAISGATISSEAVVKTFNDYVEDVKKYLKEKGLIDNDK